jgi:hypothetical protein
MNESMALRGCDGDVPELELLLACVRPYNDDADDHRIEAIVRRKIDWTYLVRTALAHGVSPLVARRLGVAHSERIPDDIRKAFDHHLLDNRDRNVVLADALFRILDALRDRDVVALPFKGQTLGAIAYGEFAMRRAGDLDILLREEDLASAWQVLESLGYREMTEFEIGRSMTAVEHAGYRRYQCEYAFFRKIDGIVVEPHWAIAPTTMAIDLDYDRFWERAGTVDVGGRKVLTLGLADLMLALCVHGSKHEWTRLQWICDVAALIERYPDLDLATLLEDARSRGVARMLLLGLGLAQRTLGARTPSVVMRSLESDPVASRLVERFADRLFRGSLETSPFSELSLLRLEMRERQRDRAAYVFRTLTTPTEKHLRLCAMPAAFSALYIPLKIGHDYIASPVWRLWRRMSPGRASPTDTHPGEHARGPDKP